MSVAFDDSNEFHVSEAFTKQSKLFDQLYGNDGIIAYKRKRVREHILRYAKSDGSMMELNCGTGDDAIFFAEKGFSVHATDISIGMLRRMKEKIKGTPVEKKITIEPYSFTELRSIEGNRSFDYVYSNFGGLNCTAELKKVLHSIGRLVKPGGTVTLVIISKFCLWETLLVCKGKFRTAFRRFFAGGGRKAHIEGSFFKCWYYSPAFIKKYLQPEFEFLSLEGLCTIVPPSYIEKFDVKYPGQFQFLVKQEDRLKARWPWNRVGDYFIISFRKK